MNTLTHILVGTAVASRPKLTLGLMMAAFGGAVFPDVSMVAMVVWESFIMGVSEAELWDVAYYREPWVTYSAMTNSFFVYGALALVGWWRSLPLLMVFGLSACLHFAGDIFLHYDDGHAHFWPVSSCVFYSPVSYWDPRHFGIWWMAVEVVFAVGLALYLWRKGQSLGFRVYIGSLAVGVAAMSLLVTMAFIFGGMDDRPESSGHDKFAQPACPGSIDVATQHAQT